MTVRFRVISELTGNDLTDKECWLLDPSGKLFYKRGDSLYEDENLKIVFDIDDQEKTGKWLFNSYNGIDYYRCSCCGTEYPLPPTWNISAIMQFVKFCSYCGATITGSDIDA